MPTISEPTWPAQEDKRKAAINDYVNGTDSMAVLEARLYAAGYRGQDISSAVKQAQYALLAKQPKRKELSHVLVLELGGKTTRFRFEDYHYAAFACRMLRRVPNVIFANVVNGDEQHIIIDVNKETFVSDMLRCMT